MINIIIFGPPGSGKGTQAKRLKEKFNLLHISTGDLFRYELGNNTELGQLARSYMDKGQLVPDEVTTAMLKRKLDEPREEAGVIYDGYPRNINQAQSLDDILGAMEEEVDILLSLRVEDDEIVKRILDRGKTSGRADDLDEKIIRDRIQVYKDQTSPVFAYYNAMDCALEIDGMGTMDEITDRLSKGIEMLLEA